jgi:hypothetical protein
MITMMVMIALAAVIVTATTVIAAIVITSTRINDIDARWGNTQMSGIHHAAG